MTSFGRNIDALLILTFVAAGFLAGCSDKNTTGKKQPEASIQKKDSTYLFNGKSLDGWDITNFGPQGPVYVSGEEIILGMGEGCTGITWKGSFPETDYVVDLDARRIAGTDFFCGITFPFGKSYCSFIVGGWGGTTVGLSNIDGKDAAENETTSKHNFEKERWYHIKLIVTTDSIRASIDEQKVVDFKSGNKKISIRPEVELSKPFGIASWYTTAGLKNIRLHRKNN